MTPESIRAAIIIVIAALVTVLLRFIPFLVFGGDKKTPGIIVYLGRVLPYAAMGMLVVYALRSTQITSYPYGIPEFIACGAVVILHIWRRNTLISIGAGTLLYMVMVQLVFK